MLTPLNKYTLQDEGYIARKEGTACPYEHRSDEWHHWQTGRLMRHYEEEKLLAELPRRRMRNSSFLHRQMMSD